MEKLGIFLIVSSNLIADIPSAGRPNPGAFIEDNTEVLKTIDSSLTDIKIEILELKKLIARIKIPEFDYDEFEKIRLEIQCLSTRLEYLLWLVDHPLEEDGY